MLIECICRLDQVPWLKQPLQAIMIEARFLASAVVRLIVTSLNPRVPGRHQVSADCAQSNRPCFKRLVTTLRRRPLWPDHASPGDGLISFQSKQVVNVR